ncbi:hypothetical protein CHS0354_042837 [Potamilus streckersoni]|uniref:Uncharacterized protein n=1 Tax=Potamilus streckersoni TaxID=2493646 RepID=A0AAE0T4Y6_9BIVA|nr:hypothetical protein CHS0354_042837 [Potamilus streckersoni]
MHHQGMIKEDVERSEEHIPDLFENEEVHRFPANIPAKGWHCKGYGHRRGDKNCPKFKSASVQTKRLRWSHEDPMYRYIEDNKRREKEKRIQQLMALLISSTDSSDSEATEKSKRKKSKRKKKKKATKPISKCQEEKALYFQEARTSHSAPDSKHKGHKKKRNDSDCLEKEIHRKKQKKHKLSSKEKRPCSPLSVKSDQVKKTVKKKKKKRHR